MVQLAELRYGYGHERPHTHFRAFSYLTLTGGYTSDYCAQTNCITFYHLKPYRHTYLANKQPHHHRAACVRSPTRPSHAPTNAKCAHVADTPNADSNSAPSTVQSELQISIISYATGSNVPKPYNNRDGLRPGNHTVPSHPNDH